ncbi:hypothetical protein [Paraburkholderia domus]|uniref:hypothetical protein n=1 Tax=Paraburkholderia domus TaxID=2793075 RepID=UPI001B113940|nr:hypothetical protein [Paraburkholderia domus]CAE6697158.1 hypothetical protein R75483_00654 [Paraburkholderia domus]
MIDGYTLGRAEGAEKSANSWMKYARELEQELVNAKAGLEAIRALKDAALSELARLDPTHPLMVQENRQKIADKAYFAYGKPKS